MNPGDVLLWMADHIEVWRPFALVVLTLLILACLWFALVAWEGKK